MTINSIAQVTVVGAGLIGNMIAVDVALMGIPVKLYVRGEEGKSKARAALNQSCERILTLGLKSEENLTAARERIDLLEGLEEAVAHADLVIEAVYEDPDVKREVFFQLDQLCPQHAILASTTSSLLVSDFSKGIGRPDKVIVAHYFQPPFLIPLVEVARCSGTSQETFDRVCTFLENGGKQPVRIAKEVAGLISSRIAAALIREALALVDQGVAEAREIDKVMRTATLRRYAIGGVFQFLDIVGLDIIHNVLKSSLPHLDNSTELPQVLKDMVDRKEMGAKSGKGFYEWTPEGLETYGKRFTKRMLDTQWMSEPLA